MRRRTGHFQQAPLDKRNRYLYQRRTINITELVPKMKILLSYSPKKHRITEKKSTGWLHLLEKSLPTNHETVQKKRFFRFSNFKKEKETFKPKKDVTTKKSKRRSMSRKSFRRLKFYFQRSPSTDSIADMEENPVTAVTANSDLTVHAMTSEKIIHPSMIDMEWSTLQEESSETKSASQEHREELQESSWTSSRSSHKKLKLEEYLVRDMEASFDYECLSQVSSIDSMEDLLETRMETIDDRRHSEALLMHRRTSKQERELTSPNQSFSPPSIKLTKSEHAFKARNPDGLRFSDAYIYKNNNSSPKKFSSQVYYRYNCSNFSF